MSSTYCVPSLVTPLTHFNPKSVAGRALDSAFSIIVGVIRHESRIEIVSTWNEKHLHVAGGNLLGDGAPQLQGGLGNPTQRVH